MAIPNTNQVYLTRMPAGIPGDVTRKQGAVIEARPYDLTNPPLAFGVPIVLDATSHRVRTVLAGDSATAIFGILVRPYPAFSLVANEALGIAAPNFNLIVADILKSGYINVLLSGTTPAFVGGPVYIRVGAPATGKPLGGFEAAADGGNTVVLPNAYFMGAADAQGNTEIGYNV